MEPVGGPVPPRKGEEEVVHKKSDNLAGRIMEMLKDFWYVNIKGYARDETMSHIYYVPKGAMPHAHMEGDPFKDIELKEFSGTHQVSSSVIMALPKPNFLERFNLTLSKANDRLWKEGKLSLSNNEQLIDELLLTNPIGLPIVLPNNASQAEKIFVEAYETKRNAFAAFLETKGNVKQTEKLLKLFNDSLRKPS